MASGEITVDENTLFSHNVMVITGRHTMGVGKKGEFQDTVPHIGYDIHIGKRCWICSGVIISGGVTIGDDCIIAAGSIVVHNVPAGSFVKGVH